MTEKKELTIKDQEILFGELGLRRYFNKIKLILDEYLDMDEDSKKLISVWIVGTYLHKHFPSYPYLFFNAMKGSGKSRALKIISNLAWNGYMVGSLSEAVLFRTASQKTMCIDEFENINSKGGENLKLLLNSAYKKGILVPRMKSKKDGGYEIEEFVVYTPIALANIWGMENILGDRCIKLILEKSNNKKITRLIENFENDIEFQTIRGGLRRLIEKITDDLNIFGQVFSEWNVFVKEGVKGGNGGKVVNSVYSVKDNSKERENPTHLHTLHTFHSTFLSISKTNIDGRHLELFFPLFIISDILGGDIFEDMLRFAKEIVKTKKEEDRQDDQDVQLIEFVSQYHSPKDLDDFMRYVSISKLTADFSDYIGVKPEWLNATWMGMNLRKNKLVIGKPKRIGTTRGVVLDILKAKQKLLMFKEPEEIDFSKSGIKEESEDEKN